MASDVTRDPSLPAVHVLHLLELARRWHVTPDALLSDLDLRRDSLELPGLRLPVDTVVTLIERARALTGEPALGFYLGYRMRISSHGFLGFAAMSASTVRESIELATRFAPTRTSALGLALETEGDRAALVIEERADFGPARDVIVFSLLVGIWQIGNALTGRALEGHAELAFPQPDYFERFASLLGGVVRFGQPKNRLVFDAAVLELPMTMADPVALRLAREQCERELDALDYEGDLVTRVRGLLAQDPEQTRSVDQVARTLHMSPRTLKRKLAAAGTTYSDLVAGERRDAATRLLRDPDLSIDEVAARLGYSDAANFTRAFRRWTGMTPRAFRRSIGTA